MKRGLSGLWVLGCWLTLTLALVGARTAVAASCPQAGEAMPDLQLSTPKAKAQKEYLGLQGAGETFKVSELPAELVVIEIFSMYCPYCQREAPVVNRFFELVRKNADASARIRIFGIGASNSDYEVDVFQSQYGIKFPLIADPELKIHEAVGGVRTPHFFVLKRAADGSQKLIYSASGGFGEPDAFLKQILEKAK